MSGFEVAGIVLGVLPRIISGLEQYKAGLDSIRAATHYREIIADLIITFAATAARYATICEASLRRLRLQEEEYLELLDNPSGPKWRNEGLTAHLQSTLGKSYVLFVQIVRRLERDITKFAERLGLDVDNGLQPEWLVPQGNCPLLTRLISRLTRLSKIINMVLENDKMSRSLTKIEDDLGRLESLLSLNTATTQDFAQTRRRKSAIWGVVREGAGRVFEALSGHWKCSCSASHQASLRLEPRVSDDVRGRTLQFQIRFLFDKSFAAATQQPWAWRDIRIHCEEDEAKGSLSLPTNPAPVQKSALTPHPTRPFQSRRVKSVTISTITAAFPSISMSGELTSVWIDPTQSSKVQDLCQTLSSNLASGDRIGIMKDAYWNHQLFDFPPLTSPPPRPISLHEHLG